MNIPDSLPHELSIGNRGGLEERSNVQHSLYRAMQDALHQFAKRMPVTTAEVVGALQCLIMEVYASQDDEPAREDGDEWKDGAEA